MQTATAERAEDLDTIRKALGPDARLYMIFARDTFALRYGPLTVEEVSDRAQWARSQHVPFMITADCGALPDDDLILDLYGATYEQRASRAARLKADALAPLKALSLTGENVAHLLLQSDGDPSNRSARLEDLRDTFKSIDRMLARFAAEDEGCPRGDPDCLGRDDQCHDACVRPPVSAAEAGLRQALVADDIVRSARDDNCELPKPPPDAPRFVALRDAALAMYREATRRIIADRLAHDAKLMEAHGALRNALIDAGIYPKQLEARTNGYPKQLEARTNG